MAAFTVNGDSLATVQTTLGGLAQYLGEVSVDATAYESVMGGGLLSAELGAFDQAWHHGISVVAREVDQLSSDLRRAVHHYQQVDGQLADRAKGQAGSPDRVHSVPTRPAHGGPGHTSGSGESTIEIGGPGDGPHGRIISGGAPVTAATGGAPVAVSGGAGGSGSGSGAAGDGRSRDKGRHDGSGSGSGQSTIVIG